MRRISLFPVGLLFGLLLSGDAYPTRLGGVRIKRIMNYKTFLSRVCLCVVLALTAGCYHLQIDNFPPVAKKGYVTISMEITNPYKGEILWHKPVYQWLDGEKRYLGELRSGGVEIGDYTSITVAVAPGTAEFDAQIGNPDVPIFVNVEENADTHVKILLTHTSCGDEYHYDPRYIKYCYTYSVKIDPPVSRSPQK